MSDSRHGRARDVLGGDVQARPRLSPEPVRALIERLRRSATRATAIAETLDGGDAEAAAAMRGVAEALDGQIATLREVLAWLTPGAGEPRPGQEADG